MINEKRIWKYTSKNIVTFLKINPEILPARFYSRVLTWDRLDFRDLFFNKYSGNKKYKDRRFDLANWLWFSDFKKRLPILGILFHFWDYRR